MVLLGQPSAPVEGSPSTVALNNHSVIDSLFFALLFDSAATAGGIILFELLREKHGERATLLARRAIGILIIATGLVALALATIQHRRALK